eukprot:1170769-Rhodomonas_salina.1
MRCHSPAHCIACPWTSAPVWVRGSASGYLENRQLIQGSLAAAHLVRTGRWIVLAEDERQGLPGAARQGGRTSSGLVGARATSAPLASCG